MFSHCYYKNIDYSDWKILHREWHQLPGHQLDDGGAQLRYDKADTMKYKIQAVLFPLLGFCCIFIFQPLILGE